MNSILKFLLHPMVAMSLMLHGLVLALPTPTPPETAAELEEEPVEEVQLSNISSLKIAPQPSPPPQVVPTPKPLPKPSVQAVLPPQLPPPAPRPVPTPTPLVTPTPVATPTPVTTPTPIVTPTPVAIATPSPEATTPLSAGTLQSSNIGAGQASAAQYYYAFPDPTAFFDPDSLQQADAMGSDPVPLDGITNMSRLERVGLNQAKDEYLPLLYPGGTFTLAGSYGGGELYEVQKDGAVGYVVLLEEDGIGLATFVVEWNQNPTFGETPAVGGIPAQ